MAMYVKQIGTGHSIEERTTKDGKPYCILGIAFNTMKKGKDGTITKEAEPTHFINAIAFGKVANFLLANKNEKAGYFGRFSVQIATEKGADGKSIDSCKVIKVEEVTKQVADETVAPEADVE